ncbi:DUF2207 domain-containing protein [Saccharibacillus sp. CPCC 101409]|uniref:DUF2207 domain-containing protein n=1 Tax=Saccharibacillus sp. CPCC 101409 TaxID=3058041 RepID=UPI0026739849|nr:DUF2207 domain-containing protein [Saccharibacillus sp. CPCC 101409]MDO3410058.1 DUF2207 domain-containing protein [Saccharibacillus sp. CPCC 101409]
MSRITRKSPYPVSPGDIRRKRRRTWNWIAALMLAVVLAVSTWGTLTERKFKIERTEVSAIVREDGNLIVYEVYDYRFKGHYNGTTRALPSSGYGKIEAFEAYKAPAELSLDTLPTDEELAGLEKLETTHRYENGLPVYRAYTESESEKVTVLYRYALSDVVHTENGTALLNWSFFDKDNQSALRNLSIAVTLPAAAAPEQTSVFLEDKYGGRITAQTGRTLSYFNDLLPKYSESRLHFRFPAELVPQAPAGAALAGKTERKLRERYALREALPSIPHVLGVFAAISAAFALLWALLPRVRRLFAPGGLPSDEQLLDLDPLRMAYIRRHSRLQDEDVASGLLSLYRKGAVRIDKKDKHGASAESRHYRLSADARAVSLQPSERFLIGWLLPNSGNETYTLNSLSGLSAAERSSAKRLEQGQKIYNQTFRPNFNEWSKLVGEEEPMRGDVRRNRWFTPASVAIVWIIAALAVYLLAAGLASVTAIVWGGLLFAALGALATYMCLTNPESGAAAGRAGILICGALASLAVLYLDERYGFRLASLTMCASALLTFSLPAGFASGEAVRLHAGIRHLSGRLSKQPEALRGLAPAEAERLTVWMIAAGTYQDSAKPPHERPSFDYRHDDNRFPLSMNPNASLFAFHLFSGSLSYPLLPGGGSDSGAGTTSSGGSGGGGGGAGAF